MRSKQLLASSCSGSPLLTCTSATWRRSSGCSKTLRLISKNEASALRAGSQIAARVPLAERIC